MTKKCPRCGYENSDTAEFCAKCGYALVGFEQTVVPKVSKPSSAQQPAAPNPTPSKSPPPPPPPPSPSQAPSPSQPKANPPPPPPPPPPPQTTSTQSQNAPKISPPPPPSPPPVSSPPPPPQNKSVTSPPAATRSSKPKEKAYLKYVAVGLVVAIVAVVVVFFVLPMTSSSPPYVLLTSGQAAAIFGGQWNNPQIVVITYNNGLFDIQGVGSSAANPIGGYTYLPAYFGTTTSIVFNGYQEAIVNTLTTPLSSSVSIQVIDFYAGSSKTAGQMYSSAVTQLASQGIAASSQGTFPAKTGVTYSYSFYTIRSDELLIAQGNNQVVLIIVKGGAGNPAFSASNILQALNYLPT